MRTLPFFLLLGACGPGALPGEVTEFELASEETGTTYQIQVFLPDAWDGSTPLRPVIALDGAQWFEWTAAVAAELSDDGTIAPPLVVAVGYGDGENLRERDYLPASEHEDGGGGVDAFFAFLDVELMAAIEAGWTVDVAPEARVLVGHSFGGFAATWAMLQGEPYGGFVALSPSYYWGQTLIFDREAELAAERQDLDARLYVAAGAGERWGLPALTVAMGETLESRGYPSLKLDYELHDSKIHVDVYPAAVAAGLAHVLERP